MVLSVNRLPVPSFSILQSETDAIVLLSSSLLTFRCPVIKLYCFYLLYHDIQFVFRSGCSFLMCLARNPFPNMLLLVAYLELLDKLYKMFFLINNHLGVFLLGLDKSVKSLPTMAKGCLVSASKPLQYILKLSTQPLANALLLWCNHYLMVLQVLNVIKKTTFFYHIQWGKPYLFDRISTLSWTRNWGDLFPMLRPQIWVGTISLHKGTSCHIYTHTCVCVCVYLCVCICVCVCVCVCVSMCVSSGWLFVRGTAGHQINSTWCNKGCGKYCQVCRMVYV